MTWPDLVIAAVALLFALKGFKRGFVGEVGGFVAIAAAIFAALHYPGTLDSTMRAFFHINPGSAHIAGMISFAIIVYAALLLIASILSRIAKLPVIGIGNALAGAAVGIVKALIGIWAVIYIALFFPLPSGLRSDLHGSVLVAIVTSQNRQIDGIVQTTMPWFLRPVTEPLFANHHV
ncbi:MAG TPA: CvpA family protein [Candidatus Elarobacter sp.]|nr:CvpA family protein [Candidatus Elarobacter sp.]